MEGGQQVKRFVSSSLSPQLPGLTCVLVALTYNSDSCSLFVVPQLFYYPN